MEMKIVVQDVHKKVKVGNKGLEILRGIDLSVEEGEFVAIMGPSGSGKSTLLGIMAGLDNATAGNVKINGVRITGMNEDRLALFRNENIGIVFQSFHLINSLSAIDNISVPLFFSSKKMNTVRRSKELLALVGLEGRGNLFPRQLSGGEQQRVAIARAMANNPSILFADEPTGALDSKNGEKVLDILKDARATYRMTIILVTHDRKVASQADRILFLNDGRFCEED